MCKRLVYSLFLNCIPLSVTQWIISRNQNRILTFPNKYQVVDEEEEEMCHRLPRGRVALLEKF